MLPKDMKQTIIKYLILSGKIAGAITSVVLMGYGFYSWSKKQGVEEATTINATQTYSITTDAKIDKLAKDVRTLVLRDSVSAERQEEIISKLDNHTIYIKAMDGTLKAHLRDTKELIEYMEQTQVEVKKNFSPIVLR
jgi:hypothetical protein